MASELAPFENPKRAILRLLKSQGCCSNCVSGQRSIKCKQQHVGEINDLLRYKEQLASKVQLQRGKLNQIPCVITLAEEIEEVKEIISGLTRQNRDRANQLRIFQQQQQEGNKMGYVVGHDNTEDRLQHEKLQNEYNNLLRTLEMTNDNNQRLIRKLAQS